LSSGASPQTPLGELTALPTHTPSWFRDGTSRGKGRREGREGEGKMVGEGGLECPNLELASLATDEKMMRKKHTL